LIGGALGLVIGIGISGEDDCLFAKNNKQGRFIFLATVDYSQATEAGRIMEQVNRSSNMRVEE